MGKRIDWKVRRWGKRDKERDQTREVSGCRYLESMSGI
jgi:hypothetical protein